jgi:site-specific DNA-methyltransferase (adenine-specific)
MVGPMINLYKKDCLEAMKEMEANAFDLAIVDPPYGIGAAKGIEFAKKRKIHKTKNWDNSPPDQNYFDELRRISKNQIIWGGNYFIDNLFSTRCMLIWDKNNGSNDLADGELAWTSFDSSVRIFKYSHMREIGKQTTGGKGPFQRIHPTQKPIALYQWILSKYAKEGDRILDTHLGSGSIAIACHDLGFDLEGYEIDEDYYQAALHRLQNHQLQLKLW